MLHNLFNNDKETANIVFEQIIDAIENQDEDTLRGYFSKTAIAEDDDFEENLLALLDFYKGEIISYDGWSGPIVSEGRENGCHYKYLESTYDVVTSEQEYRFAIMTYVIDTSNQDNIGVYSLYIIKADDTDRQFAYWGDGNCTPGIVIVETD